MNNLQILYTKNCKDRILPIKKALEKTYRLRAYKTRNSEPPYNAYNPIRNQYDASLLLENLIQNNVNEITLWVIDKDIYCNNMNFVFGYASVRQGAVLSTHRLDSIELIQKEAIHEIGHTLGLQHCKNNCVMQFSNTIEEAKKKPDKLCDRCREQLGY